MSKANAEFLAAQKTEHDQIYEKNMKILHHLSFNFPSQLSNNFVQLSLRLNLSVVSLEKVAAILIHTGKGAFTTKHGLHGLF